MSSIENEFYYKLDIQTDNLELIKYVLSDFNDIGIEESRSKVYIYCADDLSNIDFMLDEFCQAIRKKGKNIIYKSKMTKEKNQDWIEEYKKNIKAISIQDFYIYPSWIKPKDGCKNIMIEPSLAFGSGHHYTTYSMIENIIKYVKKDDEVLDIGSGSGILSLVASKIGAIVDCCDSDIIAVENTKDAFVKNDISFRDCWVGSVNKTTKKYDVILANIIADVLVTISNDIKKAIKDDGLVVLSGILLKYEDKLLQSFADFDIIENQKSDNKEWLTLVLKKR
jgi:ribosomal protein L11 methyltransferase